MRSGIVRLGRASTAVVVTTLMILSGQVANAAESGTKVDQNKVKETTSVEAGFTASLNPHTGQLNVANSHGVAVTVDSSGKVTDRQPLPSLKVQKGGKFAPNANYTCVVQTQQNSNFRAFDPLNIDGSGNSYRIGWQLDAYAVDHARFVSGEDKLQIELCETGGDSVWNSYHTWFSGGDVFIEDGAARGLGSPIWGHDVVNSTTYSTINFQVAAGPVTIGATTPVTAEDVHDGGIGHNENMTNPSGYNAAWDINRTNAFYQAPHDWIWQGSANFQGNNSNTLYEYPENWPNDIFWGGTAIVRALCSNGGASCAPFN
jgi:hypothetical protein